MAQKSTILYLITQSEWGGAQRYIFDLATSQISQDYNVHVAAGGTGELLKKLDQKDITTHALVHLRRSINPWHDTLALFELIKLIYAVKPEVVHLNSSKAGILGSITAKLCGVKRVVYTAHGFVFNEPLPLWQKVFYRVAETITAPLKDVIICMSSIDYRSAISAHVAKESKLAIIHNGITPVTQTPREQARESLTIPHDRFAVGTIANFYATKGLAYLIKAAATLKKTHPEILTVIIGFGTLEAELRKQATELGVNDSVIFATNHQSDGASLLAAFDIFVLPSLKEGFPYALLEASHASLPIIATDVGGNRDIIEHQKNGLLVPAADSNALVAAIEKIAISPDMAKRLGEAAQQKASRQWTLEAMVKQTQDCYIK